MKCGASKMAFTIHLNGCITNYWFEDGGSFKAGWPALGMKECFQDVF